jgi:hypothetical protein
MIVIGSNGITTNSPSLADSLLTSIAGLGILILVVEMIFIMIRDWWGAMTLRFAANTQWRYRGRRVSAKYWFFVLYVIFPYIMLPIYLFRTVTDQRHVAGHKPVESKRHIAQKSFHPPTKESCRVCHQPLQVGTAFVRTVG